MESLGYLYSIIVAAGGIVGYVRKGKNITYAVVPN